MKLEVNGQPYGNFKSASVEIRLDALSNTFSFSAVATGPLPFKGGDSCRVLVDEIPVLTGYIEVINGSYNSQSHEITIQGRDKTGDLLDSTIGSLSDIRPPISMKQIIEKVIKHINADINVYDIAKPPAFDKLLDISAPEPGENAFRYLEKLARRKQVLLTSNADGNIVISKADGPRINFTLQNIIKNNTNNVLSASFSYDTTGRFNLYKFASSLNVSALESVGVSAKDIVNQQGQITDPDIRVGRQLALVAESTFSNAQNIDRSKWEANIRKARGRTYSAVINGYRDFDGNLFDINKQVYVIDDFAGIDSWMLVNTVTFTYDENDGGQTTLSFLPEGAYTLELSEPKQQKVGHGFTN